MQASNGRSIEWQKHTPTVAEVRARGKAWGNRESHSSLWTNRRDGHEATRWLLVIGDVVYYIGGDGGAVPIPKNDMEWFPNPTPAETDAMLHALEEVVRLCEATKLVKMERPLDVLDNIRDTARNGLDGIIL